MIFVNKGVGQIAAPFGLAFNNGYLYVGNTASLVRIKYATGDLKATWQPEKLMDLPNGGHSTRNVTFNRAGGSIRTAPGIACLRRASAIRSASPGSRAPTRCGRR